MAEFIPESHADCQGSTVNEKVFTNMSFNL